MRNRFLGGGARTGLLARLLPIRNGLFIETRLGIVMRKPFQLGRYQVREICLQDLGHPLMHRLTTQPEQRRISRLLN